MKPIGLMDSTGLARQVRSLREQGRLTQTDVAQRIISERTGKHITKQAVSRAENEDVGSEMDGVRIRIIEELTDRKIQGPVYYFEDEAPPLPS